MQTKAQKRENLIKKLKIKQQKGATLAAQISRTKTAKHYSGKKIPS